MTFLLILLAIWIIGGALFSWRHFEHLVFAKFNLVGYLLLGPGWSLFILIVVLIEWADDFRRG